MKLPERVTIIGLGLMGGSLALALQGSGVRVTGVDLDEGTRTAALATGSVVQVTGVWEEGVAEADLIVLATPVQHILKMVVALSGFKKGGVVIDLGSTKGVIVAAMGGMGAEWEAVGGHPMCGREIAGWTGATADLYEGATFALCRTERTTPKAAEWAEGLVEVVGAERLWLTAERHDFLTGMSSHVPYVAAAALMRAAVGVGDDGVWGMSASGFRDTSRVSGTSPAVMSDILWTNRKAVLAHLAAYEAELGVLRAALAEGDEAGVRAWAEGAAAGYARYRQAVGRPLP
ncbi:MAG TPA: prephenate dehydrogenase/arogenate dehydrogenase family protein [Anaerolineae bacterium]|nr:prephenate dehydrogenase/arogenate dehydrogenase family protein [Anaerolineae bacterium]